MQSKIFNFPQHQGTLFPGVKWTWSRQPTTPRKTSTSSRRWWWRFCFFWGSVFYSLRPKYQKNDNFVLWVVKFHQAIFEGGIREPLRLARSNFLRLKKKRKNDEDTGKKPSPERHQEFPFSWNSPTWFKKTGRETLPLAIPQVELHSEFHEKRNFGRYFWF